MNEQELLEKDCVLTYRYNRYSKKLPQIELEGLWTPQEVERMRRAVSKAARIHRAGLVRDIRKKIEQEKEKERLREEKKDAREKSRKK